MESNNPEEEGFWPEWWKGPKIVKSDEELFREARDKLNDQRRKRDKIHKLVNKNGFVIRFHGRENGCIYYTLYNRICEFYFEDYFDEDEGMYIDLTEFKEWIFPEKIQFTEKEKVEIKNALIEWLNMKNMKFEFGKSF